MDALARSLVAGSRVALAKALTLCESSKPEHQALALDLLRRLQAISGGAAMENDAFRIGISGPPGAGKSSVIESLGCDMVENSNKVAVLAVDPSSEQSGGAILGDKTRMAKLSGLDNAFVRPSPSRGTLGGISRATAENMSICAAAGYDRVLVETVGVGQSEIAVASLVDCMVLILPPVGGDELQAIKRGITEVADLVVINKADGNTRLAARRAAAAFKATMHLRPPHRKSWRTEVLSVSAHTGTGIVELRQMLESYHATMEASGELHEMRCQQRAKIAWTAAEELLLNKLRTNTQVHEMYNKLYPEITSGQLPPRLAATRLIETLVVLKTSEGIAGSEAPGRFITRSPTL